MCSQNFDQTTNFATADKEKTVYSTYYSTEETNHISFMTTD